MLIPDPFIRDERSIQPPVPQYTPTSYELNELTTSGAVPARIAATPPEEPDVGSDRSDDRSGELAVAMDAAARAARVVAMADDPGAEISHLL